ncbi:MAG: cation/multidrug efflux pump [Gammaproteobacteria bacterium]
MSAAFWLDLGIGAGALLALALILNGGRHLRRGRIVRGGFNGMSGIIVGCLAAIVLLVGINLLTYARFTAEQPVGDISFRKLSSQHYAVVFLPHGGGSIRTTLDGDEWQLDARIIKWKGIATVLGFEPLYRLQRLSGRYENVREARAKPASVVALAQEPGLSLWSLAHRKANWLPLVDASYGTATYLPMADGATYHVSLSTTGLLARPANAAATQAARNWE